MPEKQPWWCAACNWKGPDEETVYREHAPLSKAAMDIATYPHGEAEQVRVYMSCPKCGAAVYQWQQPIAVGYTNYHG